MGKGQKAKFDELTPAETIAREHRKLLTKRPDLDPKSYERSRNEHDLFTMVQEVFPGTQQA